MKAQDMGSKSPAHICPKHSSGTDPLTLHPKPSSPQQELRRIQAPPLPNPAQHLPLHTATFSLSVSSSMLQGP